MTAVGQNWQCEYIEKIFGNFNGLFSFRLKNSTFVAECFSLCLCGCNGHWGWTLWIGQGRTGVGLSKRICCTLVHSSMWESLLLCQSTGYLLTTTQEESNLYYMTSFFGLFSYIPFSSLATYFFLLLWGFSKFHITDVFNFPFIYKTTGKTFSAAIICTS